MPMLPEVLPTWATMPARIEASLTYPGAPEVPG
jgi:hypothetical protein